MRTAARVLAAALLAFGQALLADFTGTVVGVSDGDTITVRANDGRTVKVRLNGIDCPEKSQGYGSRAKDFTSHYAFGKNVTIRDHGGDKYGRTIGDVVLADGRVLNTELVRSGLAWHYKQYSKDPELARLEEEARTARVGLWQDKHAQAPWDYRHGKKDAAKDHDDWKLKTAKTEPAPTKIENTGGLVRVESRASGPVYLGGSSSSSSSSGSSGTSSSGTKTQSVQGYTTKSGHYVAPYSRSSAGSGSSSRGGGSGGKH